MSLIDSDQNKEKILKNFLKICKNDGCNENSLKKSIKEAGFDEKLQEIIFENGVLDLIAFYFDSLDHKILAKVKKQSLSNLGISGKIQKLVAMKLELIAQDYEFFLQIAKYLRNCQNLKFILKNSYQFADLIWYEIGDKSTDYNFYSKRLLLSKIYLKTLIFFTKNPEISEVKQYFEQQIAKILQFAKIKNNICDKLNNIFDLKNHLNPEFIKNNFRNLPFIRLYNNDR